VGDKGLTPLCAAALSLEASAQQVEILLAVGADPTARTDDGQTPLFFVHNPIVVHRLVDAGTDVGVRDTSGRTALFAASSNLLPEVVQALLDAGLDATDTDDAKNTPLHTALHSPIPKRSLPTLSSPGKFTTPNYRPYRNSLNQLWDVLVALINAEAPLHAVNAEDETPLSLALETACEAPFHSDEEWLHIVDTLVQGGARLRANHTGDTQLHQRVQTLQLDEIADKLDI
jgi:ankyrin repeat protein